MSTHRARRWLVSAARLLRLNRVLAHVYYRYVHGFAPAGSALPNAVERCFGSMASKGLLDQTDYCEFGVFKGYTFWYAQSIANQLGASGVRFFGFDSFEGLPAPKEKDLVQEGHQPFYEGQYACSLEEVRQQLDKHGVDWGRTFLIKGYFDQTLVGCDVRKLDIQKVAVALVDCDLYSSTLDALRFLDGRLIDGAMVLMDDWKSYGPSNDREGQPRALSEFLADSNRWRCEPVFDYGAYGRVFMFCDKTQNA